MRAVCERRRTPPWRRLRPRGASSTRTSPRGRSPRTPAAPVRSARAPSRTTARGASIVTAMRGLREPPSGARARCGRSARRRRAPARPARATRCAPTRRSRQRLLAPPSGDVAMELLRDPAGGPCGPGRATISKLTSRALRARPQFGEKNRARRRCGAYTSGVYRGASPPGHRAGPGEARRSPRRMLNETR